jgi:hypothetical protein
MVGSMVLLREAETTGGLRRAGEGYGNVSVVLER